MILDPLFMFVILPRGYEVMGAAFALFLLNHHIRTSAGTESN